MSGDAVTGEPLGVVCLQGGAEFGPDCVAMDAAVLARIPAGPVVVVALAAEPGRDHDRATANAVAYYRSLGAAEVVGAPDARTDPGGARSAVEGAGLVVLPGGSPRRLLAGLRDSGLDDALRALLSVGGSVSGASAGAMVLCAWTVLPEGGTPRLVEGLGIVPRTLALPHYMGEPRWTGALDCVPADTVVLGLPECAGVLVEGERRDRLTAVGDSPTRLLGAHDERLAPGASITI